MHSGRRASAVYIWSVIAVAVFLLGFHASDLLAAPVTAVISLTLMSLACEFVCVDLGARTGTVSVSMAISVAAMILYGPYVSGWVSAMGSFRPLDFTRRVSWRQRLFNPAQVALSAIAAGVCYDLAGGGHGPVNVVRDLPALGVAVLVAGLVNVGLGLLALVSQKGFKAVGSGASLLKGIFPSYAALAPFGLVGAVFFRDMGSAGVLGVLFPLMLARYSFQRLRVMRETFARSLRVLVAALEAKDIYTRGHSERVARIAVAIGREMGLPDQTLHLLYCVGLLHDIGKIGTRDSVLKKEGVFTLEEYLEIQRHPAVGAGVVEQIRTLEGAASWVRHHHERWDGEGLPDGLRDEQIPFGARVIAVADAFDAMTSGRPYKPLETWAEAMAEMKRCEGIQFDPCVVRALERAMQKAVSPAVLGWADDRADLWELFESRRAV